MDKNYAPCTPEKLVSGFTVDKQCGAEIKGVRE